MRGLALIREFYADRRGNIAILFGLALLPIVGAMGVAVDYSFANESRTKMQAALDITALSLSKMMPLNQSELESNGRKIFLANLGKTPLTLSESNIAEQLSITADIGKLTLEVNTEYPIKMAGVLSKFMPTDIPIGSHTEVVWGQGKVEVALALDNTGSMASSGKLTQLIAASHRLIEILKSAAQNPGDAKVGIVPFGFQTKVDPAANVAASWIRWDLWEANNGTCSVSGGSSQSACTEAHCSNSQYTSKSSCQSHNQTWYNAGVGTWTPAPSQQLERLHSGSRQGSERQLRRERCGRRLRQRGNQVPRRAGVRQPRVGNGAERQLGRREQHRLRDAARKNQFDERGRQHQRHHRPRLGVSDGLADRHLAVLARPRPTAPRI